MREAVALDRAGLSQDAIGVYGRAAILCPRRPEPHIQLAMAYIKLRRFERAKAAIDFARNHVRTKSQRFGALVIEFLIAFERFCQNRQPYSCDECHHLVDCLLDIAPAHPFPLHFRVILHLEMAVDPGSMEVRRVIESERGLRAMQRYLCHAKQFPPALRVYDTRFVTELKPYLGQLPEQGGPDWEEAMDRLKLFAARAAQSNILKFQPITVMKKYFNIFAVATLVLGLSMLALTTDGIFVIDCGDLC